MCCLRGDGARCLLFGRLVMANRKCTRQGVGFSTLAPGWVGMVHLWWAISIRPAPDRVRRRPVLRSSRLHYFIASLLHCFIASLLHSFIHGSTHAGAGLRREHHAPSSRRSVLQGRSNVQQGTKYNKLNQLRLMRLPVSVHVCAHIEGTLVCVIATLHAMRAMRWCTCMRGPHCDFTRASLCTYNLHGFLELHSFIVTSSVHAHSVASAVSPLKRCDGRVSCTRPPLHHLLARWWLNEGHWSYIYATIVFCRAISNEALH